MQLSQSMGNGDIVQIIKVKNDCDQEKEKSDCEEDDNASSEEDGPATYLALNATGTCGCKHKHYGETSRALSASINAIEKCEKLDCKIVKEFYAFPFSHIY